MLIYRATNLINGMCYVGKTIKSLNQRKNGHKQCCKKDCLDYFHKALNKYGWNNFKWEIIYQCNDLMILNLMETFKIIVEHSHVDENGYNITFGGEGSYGRICSEETKRKIGNANKNRRWTDDEKKRLSNSHIGIKHTEETKKKISDSNKGRVISDSTKEKIRISATGRRHSQETIDKCRISSTGRKLSDEAKQKHNKTTFPLHY
jgi:group I intron endonuclease